MSGRRLYTMRITEASLQSTPQTNRQALENLKGVDGSGTTTPTGQQPGELRLEGQFRDDFAELLGTEFRELLSAAEFDYLPYYFIRNIDSTDTHPDAGYYPSEETQSGRVVPKTSGVTQFDVRLTREGTRQSHHRRLESPTTPITHQFGTLDFVPYGLPAEARRVRWVDSEATEATAASPARTLTAELGDVDHYDLADAPYDDPQLTWDVDYATAGNVDCKVYDTWQNPEYDTDGRFSWQQVYSADHDYRGDLIIENGFEQFRVQVNDDPPGLTLDRYRNGSWGRESLGTSDWQLYDIDVYRIAAAQVRAETDWEDTTSGDLHTLEMVLPRGWQEALFFEPADAGQNLLQDSQAPSGLVDLLDPIAAETRIDPDPRQGLIARQEIPH